MAKKPTSKKTIKADQPKNTAKLDKKTYKKELFRLQIELCKLQEWVKETQKRIVVIFEGRDAAGKGGVIKRITKRVSLTGIPHCGATCP
jgi:polyphosphate kinase 2 (PPK2 family)